MIHRLRDTIRTSRLVHDVAVLINNIKNNVFSCRAIRKNGGLEKTHERLGGFSSFEPHLLQDFGGFGQKRDAFFNSFRAF